MAKKPQPIIKKNLAFIILKAGRNPALDPFIVICII
jgi:hypothetical protein